MAKFFTFLIFATFLSVCWSARICRSSSTEEEVDDSPMYNAPENSGEPIGYQLILVPSPVKPKDADTSKCSKCNEKTNADLESLQTKVKGLEEKLAGFENLLKNQKAESSLVVDSVQIGRWRLESASDESLVIADTKSAGSRYKFPIGGNSDMYTAGTGGEIHSSRIVFPARWSIGEESVSYLVFRDRGTPGRDFRYAMAASKYQDL